MMDNSLEKIIEEIISHFLNLEISSIQFNAVGGGSINETFQTIINKKQKLFCKVNSAKKLPSLFMREKRGLQLLAEQNIIKTPAIIAFGESEGKQILILEWVDQGLRRSNLWKTFGEQLAALHKISWSDENRQTKFGLDENNYMGALKQSNKPSNSWIDFFVHQRLEPQI